MLVKVLVAFLILTEVNGVPISDNLDEYFTPRIIGGIDAPDAYAPHMVALLFGERIKLLMCGGSIISRKLVLTAAHCIDPFILLQGGLLPSFRLNIGSNQWNSGGITSMIETYYKHPLWDPDNIKYDAGILVLKEKLVLNDRARMISLYFGWVAGNVQTFVTGWGGTGPRIEDIAVHLQPTPDDLQLLYLSTITSEQCERGLQDAAAGRPLPPVQHDVEICTFHSVGHGMCNGDSGSALVLAKSGQQIGIVSWGLPCAIGAPDVYTRIQGIRDFLQSIMRKYKN